MTSGIGFRIFTKIDRPAPEIVQLFKGLPSSNINDEMNRLYCMSAAIRPYNSCPLLGTAITVKAPIGDNLLFHRALDIAQPGDIVVVDGAGVCERSLAGEMMITYAEKRGIGGIVVDGALRDLDGIRRAKIPVYARGINPQGPYKNGPGEINVPIACGGQVVFPGDILLGDEDGIVVIRPDVAQEVADRAQAKHQKELEKVKRFSVEGANEEEHRAKYVTALNALGIHNF